MKKKILIGLAALSTASAGACSKKSSNSTDSTGSNSTTSTAEPLGSLISVSTLALMPELDSFLKAKSSSASLAAALALSDRGDGYSLVTGTPPKFTEIAGNMSTYLTGDVATLGSDIASLTGNPSSADLKAKITSFLDAESKCAVMEHTARLVQRLRQDTAPLCLLKAMGPVGDKILKVASGAPVADLTKVFTPDADDKTLQIGMTDKGQPHYEMVQIKGTTSNPNGYHVVYTTCLTASKTGFRQNTLDIDNTTGIMTFKSISNGSIDDVKAKPNASFTLTGNIVADGSGGVIPDTSKLRTVTYNEAGTMGDRAGTNQGILKIIDNELNATFFGSESGTDQGGNAMVRTDKTALNVQYTGGSTSDLVVFQGAGRSIMTMTGGSHTNIADHAIGFNFDNTASPNYATTTSSDYVTRIAAVNFATDPVLSLAQPTAPDVTTLDSTPCTATPTTVLGLTDRPEDNSVYGAALSACNSFPAEKSGNMCDSLRGQEHKVNEGMKARKDHGDTDYK